ncbi:MAG TPA: hypothetical protein DEA91_22745 [Paenibacillus sp.]|nr:hypothetical protein [Paenibacillus sp.]
MQNNLIISQPYVFKVFKNKEELFVASLERAFERIIRSFQGVEAPADQVLKESIKVYFHPFRKYIKSYFPIFTGSITKKYDVIQNLLAKGL